VTLLNLIIDTGKRINVDVRKSGSLGDFHSCLHSCLAKDKMKLHGESYTEKLNVSCLFIEGSSATCTLTPSTSLQAANY
jgi:hypothetical protein